MADEFTKWQKSQPAPQTSHKRPFEAKWRATHAVAARSGENPYKREADRDRVIFRWIMAVVFIVGLVAYVVYLVVNQTSPD